MEAKAQALMTASQKLGEAMYAQSQAEAQAAANPQGGAQKRGRSGRRWRGEGGRRGVYGSQRRK